MDLPDHTLRRPGDLAAAGLVARDALPALGAVAARYAVAVTPAVARLIDPADPADPIARQYLPDPRELEATPDELADPIGDAAHSPVEGIVHRYPDRVLLKPVGACAVYCRFCFRRESVGPGKASGLSDEALDRALAYIAGHPAIWEVILSGGDPLVLSPRRLAALTDRLDAIAHLGILRVHTRVPVADPARVTAALVSALRLRTKPTWIVLHVNHPRELSADAQAAVARLADAGLPLLSQSVLLRGVNDDPAVLEELFRSLVRNRIKPYYLHQGDLAPGTAHLRTTIAAGQDLVRGLRGRVSGLCQPTYVLDIPGGHGKVPLGPSWTGEDEAGAAIATDWRGRTHRI